MSPRQFAYLPILALLGVTAAALDDCPLLGSAFPPPHGLASSNTWQSALGDFQHYLLSADSPIDKDTTSFSLNAFSIHAEDLLFDYHHEAPGLNGSLPDGKTLNGDTVYRIASISKLVTTYLFLIEAGLEYWDEPVAKYIPEIAEVIENERHSSADNTVVPQWADITLGSLASHLSGIGRESVIGDIHEYLGQNQSVELGFPPLDDSEIIPCGIETFDLPLCTRKQWFQKVLQRPPVFAPFRTPSYSNNGFSLLALALEAIKDGTSFEEMMSRSITDPLNLSWTNTEKPDDSKGIIPGDPIATFWNVPFGYLGPAGGFYSTANDLAKIGKSILSSSLICPSSTSRWLKPTTHTSSLTGSVGRGWEIYRLTQPRVIDLYTKSGDLSSYGGAVILSPDHGVGFTVLTAGALASSQRLLLANMASGILVPALEREARLEALERFSGTYVSTNGGRNRSEITISAVDDGRPGLKVDEPWVLNGVPFDTLFGAIGMPPMANLSLRLQPTGLVEGNKVAFRMILESAQPSSSSDQQEKEYERVFSDTCGTWFTPDGVAYGNEPIDEFVFEVDGDGEGGRARGLELRAWNEKLERAGQ